MCVCVCGRVCASSITAVTVCDGFILVYEHKHAWEHKSNQPLPNAESIKEKKKNSRRKIIAEVKPNRSATKCTSTGSFREALSYDLLWDGLHSTLLSFSYGNWPGSVESGGSSPWWIDGSGPWGFGGSAPGGFDGSAPGGFDGSAPWRTDGSAPWWVDDTPACTIRNVLCSVIGIPNQCGHYLAC